MSLFEDEVKALRAEIQHVPSTQLRSALNPLLDLIGSSPGLSPTELLRRHLAQIKAVNSVVKITARDATIPQLIEIFDLTTTWDMWTLAEDKKLKVPNILLRNLNDLRQAFYEEQSEATCRIAIDLFLIQCQIYVKKKYHLAKAEPAFLTAPSTPTKNAFNVPAEAPRKPNRLYPESTIYVEVPNGSFPNKKTLVTGRADWVIGYSSKNEDGALLVALEAKQQSEFSSGEAQLIAYLAILRERRRQTDKTNIITQGLYSDGNRFAFIYISSDGTIVKSPTWDIRAKGGKSMVFSFIVAMLETALKSTPTATPTKPGKKQDKEIQNYEDEVWSKTYQLMAESSMIDDDDDDDIEYTDELPAYADQATSQIIGQHVCH